MSINERIKILIEDNNSQQVLLDNLVKQVVTLKIRIEKLEKEESKKQRFKATMSKVESVDIDDDGTFKYVLIKLKDEKRFIVRGYEWAEYHADIYEKVEEQLGKIKSTCVGGGRIRHDSANKQILVYGYSVGFGRADHSVAVNLLKEKYPDYQSITFTNEGY